MNKITFANLLFVSSLFMTGCGAQSGGGLYGLPTGDNFVEVALYGVTDPELEEIFSKIVASADGVVEARRLSSRIATDSPLDGSVAWAVILGEGTQPFQLQTAITDMTRVVGEAQGYLTIRGIQYRYSPDEVDLLKGLCILDTTSRRLTFTIDRELARDREMIGR